MKIEFMECDACREAVCSNTLCASCLCNRNIIRALQETTPAARTTEPPVKPDRFWVKFKDLDELVVAWVFSGPNCPNDNIEWRSVEPVKEPKKWGPIDE